MSLGYVKGKFWVPDTRFDIYSQLPCYTALLKALRAAGLSISVEFSYTAQRYTASIMTFERFEKSAQTYMITHGNAYDPHPMAAMTKVLMASPLRTPRVMACCLEIECLLLSEVTSKAREREDRLEQVLDHLAESLVLFA